MTRRLEMMTAKQLLLFPKYDFFKIIISTRKCARSVARWKYETPSLVFFAAFVASLPARLITYIIIVIIIIIRGPYASSSGRNLSPNPSVIRRVKTNMFPIRFSPSTALCFSSYLLMSFVGREVENNTHTQ